MLDLAEARAQLHRLVAAPRLAEATAALHEAAALLARLARDRNPHALDLAGHRLAAPAAERDRTAVDTQAAAAPRRQAVARDARARRA